MYGDGSSPLTMFGNYLRESYSYTRSLSGTTVALLVALLMTWALRYIYKLSYGFSLFIFLFLFAYLYTIVNRERS